MGGFVPLPALWTPERGALFPSKPSARWFLSRHRQELLEAQALAMHAGRMLVHPARVEAVALKVALAAAANSAKRAA
jgi:hypothetical protein